MTTKRPATPEEFEAIVARLRGLSHEEKVNLAARTRPVAEKKTERTTAQEEREWQKVPETDDELHAAIVRETGFNIPRVAVCEDHCAPFDPIADGFFHRRPGILIMKSREAGGTLGASILQYVMCKFLPGHEGVIAGAIEQQAEKALSYVKDCVEERKVNADGSITRRTKDEIDGEPLRKRIGWKNTSFLKIIIATVSGVNSPHPNTAHLDELDLMEDDVIAQAANMSSSSIGTDGKRIPALDLVTSTRKSLHGPMQKLITEIEEAEKLGYEASHKLYAYCIFEASEEVPSCRCAPDEQRRARLTELGLDPESRCQCDAVVKGMYGDDIPRTLQSVCRGRLFRSRGWMSYDDVKRKFRKNSVEVWEAEMECRRPMTDGLYLPGWSRGRFTTVGWQPRPELGKIWLAVDWGGSAESAILWFQGPLVVPVKIQGPEGLVTVPLGAYVVFDEWLEANIGAGKLGDKVVAKEIAWRRQIPGFRVTARFADMAGKQQRDDWREHKPPLPTVWYLPNRDFDPTVRTLQDLVGDRRYWVDSRCSRHMDDIESWRQKNGKEVHDDACLVAGTLVETARGCVPIEEVRVGDYVLTRSGMRRVYAAGVSGSEPQPVKRLVAADGSSLIGTGNHRVWTQKNGFVDLAHIDTSDTLLVCQKTSTGTYASSEFPLSTTGSCGIAIQKPPSGPSASISLDRIRVVRDRCIARFGATIMGKYQGDGKCTTRMATLSTTRSRTWSVCQSPSILGYIGLRNVSLDLIIAIQTSIKPRCLNSSSVLLTHPRDVHLDREEERSQSLNVRSSRVCAISAEVRSRQFMPISDGAQLLASRNGDDASVSITLRRCANSVARHSWLGSSRSQPSGFVPVVVECVVDEPRKQWVYDLSVEGTHEFVANGILVHNSHSMASARYGLSNTEALERRKEHTSGSSNALPVVVSRPQDASLAAAVHGGGDPFADERAWRERLGESFDTPSRYGRIGGTYGRL